MFLTCDQEHKCIEAKLPRRANVRRIENSLIPEPVTKHSFVTEALDPRDSFPQRYWYNTDEGKKECDSACEHLGDSTQKVFTTPETKLILAQMLDQPLQRRVKGTKTKETKLLHRDPFVKVLKQPSTPHPWFATRPKKLPFSLCPEILNSRRLGKLYYTNKDVRRCQTNLDWIPFYLTDLAKEAEARGKLGGIRVTPVLPDGKYLPDIRVTKKKSEWPERGFGEGPFEAWLPLFFVAKIRQTKQRPGLLRANSGKELASLNNPEIPNILQEALEAQVITNLMIDGVPLLIPIKPRKRKFVNIVS
jgi:hypothetical protein